MQSRHPDSKPEENQEVRTHGQKLLDAIQSGDASAVDSALKSAFQEFDSEPHKEGPHIEKHTYEAQNKEAGE